jgi:hypothetical protein
MNQLHGKTGKTKKSKINTNGIHGFAGNSGRICTWAYTGFKFLILVLFISHCNSGRKKNPEAILSEEKYKIEEAEPIQPKEEFRLRIRNTEEVLYYELPDSSVLMDPDEYGSFSSRVRNPSHLTRLETLLTSSAQTFLKKPNQSCLPYYSSALKYLGSGHREVVYYSRNCSVLYIQSQGIYVDISEQGLLLEDIFRQIRSGR